MSGKWHLTPRASMEAKNDKEPGVLLDAYSAAMFTCNEVAWALLQRLEKGSSLDELTAHLASAFDVAEATAQHDIQAFLHHLRRMGFADVQS